LSFILITNYLSLNIKAIGQP